MAKNAPPRKPDALSAFRRLEDHPTYSAACAKFRRISDEHAKLRAELARRVAASPTPKDRAAAILAGEEWTDFTPAERQAMERQVAAYASAIELQEKELEKQRQQAQRELREERISQHRQIGLRIHNCLLALRRAIEEENVFLEQASADGCGEGHELHPFGFAEFPQGNFVRVSHWEENNRERLGLK